MAPKKPNCLPWWRWCLATAAFNVYVFTGSRHAFMVMEWAFGQS